MDDDYGTDVYLEAKERAQQNDPRGEPMKEKPFKLILPKTLHRSTRKARLFYKDEDISKYIISINMAIAGQNAPKLILSLSPVQVEVTIEEEK